MLYHWLNRQDNKKLIVFFAGWSFDYLPFEFLACDDYDVLVFYDYNSLECEFDFEQFSSYSKKYLLTWSMGVYCAYLLKEKFSSFDKKIAINGTVYPVDNELGIPLKPFLLTLKHAQIGLQGKFYRNLFISDDDYERYSKKQILRTVENRVCELKSLYESIKNADIIYDKFYDFAIVSKFDKIIPAVNQINFWDKNNVEIKLVESGHFPYYNYRHWNDILCL